MSASCARGMIAGISLGFAACAWEPPPPAAPDEPLFRGGMPAANLTSERVAAFDPSVDYFPDKARFTHARKVAIAYHRHFKVATITLEGRGQQQHVLMIQRGTPRPVGYPDAAVVWVPVRRWSSSSFPYAGVADAFGVLDGLVSLGGSFMQATAPGVVQRIANGRIRQHRSDEQAALLELDMILSWAPYLSQVQDFELSRALGLTTLLMVERLEATPLARSEWIKYFAALFNKEAEAEAHFATIEAEYQRLAALTRQVTLRPVVLVDLPDRNGWTSVGAGNASARLIEDAGGSLAFADNTSISSQWREPLERAIDRALDADVRLLTESIAGRPDLAGSIASNPYTRRLPALARGAVYINHAGRPGTPNPYWDQGLLNPHLLLADHIKMLHPALLPEHSFIFLRPLSAWLARRPEGD